ncbi:hypothetical protein PPL_09590 [Heterostelium album PN500]|uniref:Uncharacterized protein n=1 Tax=Heterostelium pallidum (strain ATCC 26659 / Pp 5 / PN500) TaxID=670386 RepID=D3BNR9_HETP5|nr:hypothetical protein PPL_09590 [Heterostelium album PN500]EFA76838.1 hypothetical protein PPL_09590 [Heterostelium album PN500]|eukprot:XP_020428970.1 hypothetical protein PPL_09590 [Heterostelium album PN500]
MDRFKVLQRGMSFRGSVRKNAEKLYYLDLGAADINYHPKYHRSKCGILASVVVLVIVIFFIIMTTAQFSKGVPSIIYNANIPSQYAPMDTPFVGVGFSSGNRGITNDPSLFTVKFNKVTIYGQDKKPRTKVPIATVPCTFYQNPPPGSDDNVLPEIYTNATLCPNETVTMMGTYEMEVYQYLDIGVYRCTCPPATPNCGCANDTEFNSRFFTDSTLNVLVVEKNPSYSVFAREFSIIPRDPDFAKPPTQKNYTFSKFWYNSKYQYQKVDISIQRKTIYNGPRFVFDYHVGNFYGVGGFVGRAYDYDPNQTTLFKAYIRLDEYDNQEYRQSPALLQLIGSWGALWTFFSLTVLQLARIYNNRKYHNEKEIKKIVNDLVHGSPVPSNKNFNPSIINESSGDLAIYNDSNNNNNNNNNNNEFEANNAPRRSLMSIQLGDDNNNNTNNNNNNNSNSNMSNSIEMGIITTNTTPVRQPKNILHASSGSLDKFVNGAGWANHPNQQIGYGTVSSFGINSSIDLNNSDQIPHNHYLNSSNESGRSQRSNSNQSNSSSHTSKSKNFEILNEVTLFMSMSAVRVGGYKFISINQPINESIITKLLLYSSINQSIKSNYNIKYNIINFVIVIVEQHS